MKAAALAAFIDKVDVTVDGCWIWTGASSNGYGSTAAGLAHRVAFEHFVGPIPTDLLIDHLCRNRTCVRPDHLELVTHQENVRRGAGVTALNAKKGECDRGHPFTEENTRIWRGRRVCRACDREKKSALRSAS